MKKGLKIGAASLAALMVFGATGCNVSDADGAKWAEENGYVKYEDSFTTASVPNASYGGLYEDVGTQLATAMASYHGQYVYTTTNPDGTTNMAYFIPTSLVKNSETNKWELTQGFGEVAKEDGTYVPNQTTQNLIREGKGSLYFANYGYGESVVTYSAVTGDSAPEFEAGKYYSKAIVYYSPVYTELTEEPADWATNYNTYYTRSIHTVDMTKSADSNEAIAVQINFTVKSKEENTTRHSYTFVLEVTSVDRVS